LADGSNFQYRPATVRQLSDIKNGGRERTVADGSYRPPKSSFLSSKMRFFTMADDTDDTFRILLYLRKKRKEGNTVRRQRPGQNYYLKLEKKL